jgi:hypothetical protein
MQRFASMNDSRDLRFWRGEIIVGEPAAVARMCEAQTQD